ncbi:hypothetical protein FDP41_003792 [Naegleria fowleri]|uniref:Uncharacterized protein n=1 Tax=Naegleria fowleri TaxID=5763 RepID=A0A6A5BW34_NAEFO|nr:uncharacterized protein FDP41_003792 [Naegleria fowleri]KAF0977139.1 hypothetical protein FDP41_003792 [Naegleria fowleri]CAG4707722.1 unnamed protein product [Naegleria fowleri]
MLVEVFKGPSGGSGKTVIKEFTFDCRSFIYNCRNKTDLLSDKRSCANNVPLSPQVDEYMELEYPNTKCSGVLSSVRIYSLDTCIPSEDGSSYMYKGCKSKVIYSDPNCQHEVDIEPIQWIGCYRGWSTLCNHTIPGNSTQTNHSSPLMLTSCVNSGGCSVDDEDDLKVVNNLIADIIRLKFNFQ